jgi:hypothetical protein
MNKKQVNNEKIIELYDNGFTLTNIAKEFGFKSYGPIRRVLLEKGFNLSLRKGSNSRTKQLNENYFKNIDTPNKAYILGWIISDGYVTNNKLKFGIKDLEILEFIKKELKSEHKISEIFVYDKRTEKTYQQYVLQICSKKISESLNKLGVHQAKSFTADLPNIDEKLYPHLIRGIFDGDGYVGLRTNNKGETFPRFSMIVSENLYNKLEIIFSNLGVEFMKPELVSEKDGNKILKIIIHKKKDLRLVYNYIYGDGNVIKLNRKHKKFTDGLTGNDPVSNFTIKKYNLNGELINTYKSIRNAAKDSFINYNTLYDNIITRGKKEYNGFNWLVKR